MGKTGKTWETWETGKTGKRKAGVREWGNEGGR
jgi:hypothetical protein